MQIYECLFNSHKNNFKFDEFLTFEDFKNDIENFNINFLQKHGIVYQRSADAVENEANEFTERLNKLLILIRSNR
jgi:hypothetical protein